MSRVVYFLLFLCSCSSAVEKNEVELRDVINNDLVEIENFENTSEEIYLDLELSPKEYSNWVNQYNQNPLIKEKKIDQINYELKFVPVAQMINNDLRKKEITKKEYDSLYREYSGMEYYQLKLSIDDFNEEIIKYNLINAIQYQDRIKYVSFQMQNDINLEFEGNIVPCDLYHYERTYGVAPHAKILLGFSKEKIKEDIKERTIVFDDQLFNKGLIKYNYTSDQLENIPKIKVS